MTSDIKDGYVYRYQFPWENRPRLVVVLVARYSGHTRSLIAPAEIKNNGTIVEPILDVICTVATQGLQDAAPHLDPRELTAWRDRLAHRIRKG